MKRFLLLFAMLLTMSATYAETIWFNTTAFAQATVYNGKYYWGDWQKSDMLISMDVDNDVIVIYSPTRQIYRIVYTENNGNSYRDNSGGTNIAFKVIDQDNDRGTIRLRIERNGNSQLYVDFNNVAWVYNVIRR